MKNFFNIKIPKEVVRSNGFVWIYLPFITKIRMLFANSIEIRFDDRKYPVSSFVEIKEIWKKTNKK